MGIDVGSVSTNIALTDKYDRLVEKLYIRTSGRPMMLFAAVSERYLKNWG